MNAVAMRPASQIQAGEALTTGKRVNIQCIDLVGDEEVMDLFLVEIQAMGKVEGIGELAIVAAIVKFDVAPGFQARDMDFL